MVCVSIKVEIFIFRGGRFAQSSHSGIVPILVLDASGAAITDGDSFTLDDHGDIPLAVSYF